MIENSTFNIFAFQKALHTIIFNLKNCFGFGERYLTPYFYGRMRVPYKVNLSVIGYAQTCEQTHAAFWVGLSLDQGQGGYSGWSNVDVSSQLRICHRRHDSDNFWKFLFELLSDTRMIVMLPWPCHDFLTTHPTMAFFPI